jgi:hypothetical protein
MTTPRQKRGFAFSEYVSATSGREFRGCSAEYVA